MIPIVGFYTINTPYEMEALEMRASAFSVGLSDVNLYRVASTGMWSKNCQQKAEVLLDACQKLREPFLYVDVDARFVQYPHLFDGLWLQNYDLAVHFYKGSELLTGTMWVNPTQHTYNLLKMWIQENQEHPHEWDQKVLQRTIEGCVNSVDLFKLPPEYTWIFDTSPKVYGPDIEPVIVHYQASRRFKRMV